MAATLAAQARDAVRVLRTMPADLRAELTAHVGTDVAEPLATPVRAAASTSVARRVQVTVAKGVEPAIRAGGAGRRYSGGASGRQTFYGTEFGGGLSHTWYRRPVGVRARSACTGPPREQFVPAAPFVLPTFAAQRDVVSEAWLAILDPILDAWAAGGG